MVHYHRSRTTARGATVNTTTERRRFRRLSVSLPIVSLEFEDTSASPEQTELRTGDISPNGMMVYLSSPDEIPNGTKVSFELAVPPGEGYSSSEGRIRGSGQVVRVETEPSEGVGVGICFTKPLSLDF